MLFRSKTRSTWISRSVGVVTVALGAGCWSLFIASKPFAAPSGRSGARVGKCADCGVATGVVVADAAFDSKFLRPEEAEVRGKKAFREE